MESPDAGFIHEELSKLLKNSSSAGHPNIFKVKPIVLQGTGIAIHK